MALIVETITIDGADFTRNYSDAGYFILQTDTGFKYVDAIDPINNPNNHSYAETDEPIDPETEPEDEDAAYALAGRILLGDEEE